MIEILQLLHAHAQKREADISATTLHFLEVYVSESKNRASTDREEMANDWRRHNVTNVLSIVHRLKCNANKLFVLEHWTA